MYGNLPKFCYISEDSTPTPQKYIILQLWEGTSVLQLNEKAFVILGMSE